MDSIENYVSVSLPEENWRNLHALLDFEFSNSAKSLALAREMKREKLISFYLDKLAFLGVCMDEISYSLIKGNNGNKDLCVNAAL